MHAPAMSAVRVASVLVGAVIGAGFASGREIVTFFNPLGNLAPLATAVAAGVLATGGTAVVRVAVRREALSYGGIFAVTAGRGAGALIDAVVTAFLFLTVSVTLAGGTAIVQSGYGVPAVPALMLVAVTGCILTSRGAGGLLRAAPALTPLLMLALITITGCALTSELAEPLAGASAPSAPTAPTVIASVFPGPSPPAGVGAAVASGALYGAYNLILAVGVFVAGTRYESPAGAAVGGLAGAGCLGGVAYLVLSACRRVGARSLGSAIPVAELAACLGPAGKHIYAVTLFLAVVTTLTAASMSIAERVCAARPSGLSFRVAAPAVIALAAVPAAAGFANLVKLVYPPMGLVGLAWLVIFLVRWA